ncbi:8848_t:CDS:1, partial [Cetraspora pellucida]
SQLNNLDIEIQNSTNKSDVVLSKKNNSDGSEKIKIPTIED